MRKIYFDTSVFSHLDAKDVPIKMAETTMLFDILKDSNEYEKCVSSVVLYEISECYEPKRSFMLDKLAENECLTIELAERHRKLLELYLEYGVLAEKNQADLLHVAVAVAESCNLILSWNMKHLANFKTVEKINEVNFKNGLPGIQIITPHSFLEEIGR